MITIEEFEVAAKDLAKAFKRLDSVTIATDADNYAEAEDCCAIGDNAIAIIKQYWIETASKRHNAELTGAARHEQEPKR